MTPATKSKKLEERIEEQEQQWAEASVRATEMWERAGPARKDHAYLAKKGITDPGKTIRQLDGNLVIAMMELEGERRIMSVQEIFPNGFKKFMPGGRSSATRTTIGGEWLRVDGSGKPETGQTIYICEGWATGWTIAHVMHAPVLVAFTVGNLKPVADYAKKTYVPMGIELVVAADNDRWSGGNPGVSHARKAIYPPFGRFAIPDFKDPGSSKEDGKTDFNDLWLAEGPDAVRHWLDPDRASEATTTPVAASGSTEVETEEGDDPPPQEAKRPLGTWLDTKPFRLLGHNRGLYFFLPETGGQIVSMRPTELERTSNLCQLAGLAWWSYHFEAGKGVDTKAAADALIQASHAIGIYRADNLRGRGCWTDELEDGANTGIVLHLGNRMFVPGSKKAIKPEAFASPGGYMYEKQARIVGPHPDALNDDEAADVLDLARSFLWADPVSGDLLAGWVALAPLCGALAWRPHVWLTGERGCGKSEIQTRFVVPLLGGTVDAGGTALHVVGETTEPGVRQELRADALPVVFDEAEEGEGVGSRIQKVLALARQASSESDARTLKGTTHGSSLQFRIRSMFCFASIGAAVYQEADKSRISLLTLRGSTQVDATERIKHWARIQPRLIDVTPTLGRRLFTRTLKQLRSGALMESVRIFRKVGGTVFGDQRSGDQYGTLFAGAWSLQSVIPPTEAEAREMLESEDVDAHAFEQLPEGLKALQIILQQRERVDTTHGAKTFAIGQLVDVVTGNASVCTKDEANIVLMQIGIRVEATAHGYEILVANNSEWIHRALAGTSYARNPANVLRGLDGVSTTDRPVRFHRGLVCRATRVPYARLEDVA